MRKMEELRIDKDKKAAQLREESFKKIKKEK